MTERRHLLIRLGLPALIVLGLAALALIIVNLDVFDQELDGSHGIENRSDELPALADVAPDDDAMLYMLGLTAASDREPQRVGAERRAASRDAAEPASDRHSNQNDQTADAAGDLAWLDRYPSASCNSRSQLGCLDRLLQDLAAQPVEDARLLVMLDRYRALRSRPGFDEAAVLQSGSSLRPDYGMVLRLARLNAAVRLHAEGAEAALSELATDRAFWEMMLRESDSMLARMVAVAGLWTQLQFVSELVATESMTSDQLQRAAAIVRALPPETTNLGSAFATEQQTLAAALDDLRARSSLARRIFIALGEQPNATLNRFGREVTRPMIELSGVDPGEFRRSVAQDPAPDFGFRVFPPGLYNLGGTMLLQPFRSYSPWDYIGRMHDLSGMLGLVRLQIEIERGRRQGSAGASFEASTVERLVAGSRERNPYTQESMRWERDDRTLGFECFGESVCQIRIESGL